MVVWPSTALLKPSSNMVVMPFLMAIFLISFADAQQKERWHGPVRAALRLLAYSGLGGERGRGWGRAEAPEFIEGSLPHMILPDQPAEPAPATESEATAGDIEPGPDETTVMEASSAYWLLSLFTPAATDAVDWSRGNYRVLPRGGRVESPVRSGELKKVVNMVAEGSVVLARKTILGTATDVAPDGFPHEVYRSGFALAIPIRWQATA